MFAKFATKTENKSWEVNSTSLDRIQILVVALENVNANYFILSKNGRKHMKYHFENAPQLPKVWEA